MDIMKQVQYWKASAAEDWQVGASLVRAGKVRHGLFFLHLAIGAGNFSGGSLRSQESGQGSFSMVKKSVIKKVRQYLGQVRNAGIPIEKGVIFGSYALGKERRGSDIDLLVVSPLFDQKKDNRMLDQLWRIGWRVDNRIEPFAIGVREFAENEASPILAIAQREGVSVRLKRR